MRKLVRPSYSFKIKGVDLFHSFKICLVVFFVIVSSKSFGQIAPVNPPLGGFHIDGGLKANTPTINVGDWIFGPGGTGDSVLRYNGTPFVAANSGLKRDLFNSGSDSVFAQGSKFNDYISSLHWTASTAPNKNDINNAMYHVTTSGSDQWIMMGGDRLSTDGTSYIDFEFLQDSVKVNSNGTFTGTGPAGGRTLGDLIASIEYNNGGSTANVIFYKWTLKSGTYVYDSTGSASISLNNYAFAKTNDVTQDVPFQAFGSSTYIPFSFVEAAVNVTQLLNLLGGNNCVGLKIKTLWVKTKASSVTNAALKDFVTPISVSFSFGGVSIDSTNPVCVNHGTITLTGSPSGGTFSGTGVTGNTFDPSVAGVGTHQIIYEASAGPSCTKKDTTYIQVRALPTASISGTTTVCKNATAPFVVFTGSGGTRPYTFSYTIDGGSTLTKTTTGNFDTARVAVPTGGTAPITYALTGVSDANCSNTASGNAVITINPLPTADAGTAPSAQCYNASGNTFSPSGSGLNGAPSWSVQSNPNNLTVQITSGTTYTPSVKLSGSSSGGNVTLLLTVTSNTTPACGSATSTVIVTVTGQQAGPDVSYIAPLCDEDTFKVRVNSPVISGATYTIKDRDGASISGVKVDGVTTSTYIPQNTNTFYFSNIPAGSGYQITVTNNGCVSSASSCGQPSQGVTSKASINSENITESQTTVKAYPNPFSDRVKFVVTSPVAGKGILEVYNMMGQRVKTVYQGFIAAGTQTFELSLPTQQISNLVYVLRIGDKKMSGKLLQINQ